MEDLPEDVKSDLQIATHTATHGVMYFLLVVFLASCSSLAYCTTRRTRRVSKFYMRDLASKGQQDLVAIQELNPCKV